MEGWICLGILIVIIVILNYNANKKTAKIKKENEELKNGTFVNEEELIEEEQKATKFPYYLEKSLLTNKEKAFYTTLKPIADEKNLIIISKMRLADIFKVPKDTYNSIKWFNYIKAKHADFVLCDVNFKPLMIIEVDDKTHQYEDRARRDKFVNEVCRQAGITIHHFYQWDGTEGVKKILFPEQIVNETVEVRQPQ